MIQVNRKFDLNFFLRVFFLLGWLNTFEQYFGYMVETILNTVITILDKNKNYKFIWAEISFLSLWWDQATVAERELLKRFVNNKQLEIVTGGWVSIYLY